MHSKQNPSEIIKISENPGFEIPGDLTTMQFKLKICGSYLAYIGDFLGVVKK